MKISELPDMPSAPVSSERTCDVAPTLGVSVSDTCAIDSFQSAVASWNVIGRMMSVDSMAVREAAQTPDLDFGCAGHSMAVCQEALARQQLIGQQLSQIALQMETLKHESERLRLEGAAAARVLIDAVRDAYLTNSAVGAIAQRLEEPQTEPTLASAAVAPSSVATIGKLGHESLRYVGPGGEVWLGKGRYPKWLKDELSEGRKLSDFACGTPTT